MQKNKVIKFIFIIVWLLKLCSCQLLAINTKKALNTQWVSRMDAARKVQAFEGHSVQRQTYNEIGKNNLTSSFGVLTYQKILRPSLFSSCDYFPNDSRKAQILFKNCAPAVAVVKSMARFLEEPDAFYLNSNYVLKKDKIYVFESEITCELFN